MVNKFVPARKDGRIIIHFDYDCFYASVFEAKNPALKSLPFAVQQKQIIVTCNYEARRRGLHKLQLIKDARRICPDVIIELGEDISQFRDASKELYGFIKGFSWNNKIERLGFDEVWMDVTDMVDYNVAVLNRNDLENSFFQLVKDDPTVGFGFDATIIAGHAYPKDYVSDPSSTNVDELSMRLRLGSHLALYIRHQLEQQKGYTSTVGISTNKLLSKLVGNLNKPKGQTTVMPPLAAVDGQVSNANTFMDDHEIGKVPGIGFKLAQKLREFILQRPPEFDDGLVYGGTKEKVTVADVRNHPDVDSQMLEKLLSGPGSAHGIGYKIWCLLHGIDDSEVSAARAVPRQISIEDSYIRLDTMPELFKELTHLAQSLLTRMRIDLLGEDDDFESQHDQPADEEITNGTISVPVEGKKWLARAKVLRLTTRPRQPLQPDGTRQRSFKRISHSGPLPNFVFSLTESVDGLAEKLVKEALVGMFRKLHPEKAGWNLSLVNLAVTNMAETAGDSKTANGRDIGSMFRKQEDMLKDFRVTDVDTPPSPVDVKKEHVQTDVSSVAKHGIEEAENIMFDEDAAWDDGEDENDLDECCSTCHLRMPAFAMGAHRRFHLQILE
ncbi:DNA polymerase iota [Pseudocercospora fuligena]|uniref:DNA polymerase iota n=1 Tax=Pseudocercospora fuligena TaxID=685502 RepID=A0A8H6VD26_9PEZI|nr:DNA polymerase iota [Pseudocercospora fuligena]